VHRSSPCLVLETRVHGKRRVCRPFAAIARRRHVGTLAQLAAARNASDLRDAAHAAKGASASVGAVPASSLLEKLQFAATDADWAQINGLMPQIETAFADLERFIGRLEAA
jgi:HPt (histidine-containing phosphotransfer) domain-containing protein